MKWILVVFWALFSLKGFAENGYDLWLRYVPVGEESLLREYRTVLRRVVWEGTGDSANPAAKDELERAAQGMLGVRVTYGSTIVADGTLVVGFAGTALIKEELKKLGAEGYILRTMKVNGFRCTVIAANKDVGLLYGLFHLLRLMQTRQSLTSLDITERPAVAQRILDHWDNPDGTIERGYAGYSLWDWQRLPGYIDKRYIDYARADASVGINGVVLNNVNAKAKNLTTGYIVKTAALAKIFRGYGIRVYLSVRWTAPMELGKLKTADPMDPGVQQWWREKVDEIYGLIPDFGGFLVKANSEGQPGPQDYGRSHADGANMLAAVLAPHGGIVLWRAFVYANRKGEDRAKQAYEEFKPLDGKFAQNVLLQIKNGPIDFQPREAVHPLFGALPGTRLALEVQITQEYFGFASHLVYLGSLYKEVLEHDTYDGGTVAKIINGQAIAGVSNVGSDINWCGHPFGQANWYAFGRLAWNPGLDAGAVAEEWIRMTWSNDERFIRPVKKMMMGSREATVDYMMPLGLSHIMNLGTHYGPGPWDKIPGWNAWDYHRSDSLGIGIDRTSTGSDAVVQYALPLQRLYVDSCPEKYLLWFHHLSWGYRMHSGKSLWEELVRHYYSGVEYVRDMEKTWAQVRSFADAGQYESVRQLLVQQEKEARWWRDGCVLYFQTYSHMGIPAGLEKPAHALNYYKQINFPE